MNAKAGEATITGQVMCDAGYVQEGSDIAKMIQPLVSGKVVVMMAYSQLGTGDGYRQFTADIVNGVYAIKVPVSMKSVEVTIKVEPFLGVYGDLNAKNEIVATAAYFRANNPITIVGLVANETRKLDKITVKADKMYNPSREQAVILSGEVEKEAIKDGSYETFANAELFVYVTYESNELMYSVTTDKDGKYALNMKLFDDWKLESVKVQVKSKYYVEVGKDAADKKVEATYDVVATGQTSLNMSAYTGQEMPKLLMPITSRKELE